MRTFTRITTDPAVNNGLASIRDTGILVSEVVQRVMAGKSETEVLAAYPALEHEDVFEALGYRLEALSQQIAIFQNESRVPVSGIEGYIHLLSHLEEIPASQREDYIRQLSKFSSYLRLLFDNFFGLVGLDYSPRIYEWSSTTFPEIMARVLGRLPQNSPEIVAQVQVADDLPLLRVTEQIHHAITSLLWDYYSSSLSSKSTLKAYLEDNRVRVQVVRDFQEKRPSDSFTSYDFIHRFEPPLSITTTILRQHGSELDIQVTDTGVTFTFSLPMWNDAEA